MNRLQTGCTRLLVLAFAAACSDDPVSQGERNASLVSAGTGANLASKAADKGDKGDKGSKRFIAVLDDCDPSDPAWAPLGGCVLKGGAVTTAAFDALLASPLSTAVVGHPAWRNEPSYVKIGVGESVRVTNVGGRPHTFTEVAAFGGGRVPPLRVGLTPAPECLAALPAHDLLPGASLRVEGLSVGTHRFMCCIHSWMRAAITVLPGKDTHAGQ